MEWRFVLQLLPVVDFDAMRDMIISAYTKSPYFNPMGVVTENARSLPQPDLILNIFLQYKWIIHSLIIDGIVNIMGFSHTFPCHKPHALYIWQTGIGELHSSISELHSTSYTNGQPTISELH